MQIHASHIRWLPRQLESLFLLATMAALLGLLGWVVAGSTGVVLTILASVALMTTASRVSGPLLLRMAGATELHPLASPRLFATLRELSRRAELDLMPRLFLLPSSSPIAFTTSLEDGNALAISRGLLFSLDASELEAVMAHEVSHIRNGDIGLMALASSFSRITAAMGSLGSFLAFANLLLLLAGVPPISFFAVLILLSAPALSILMQLALSRLREYDADHGAAELCGGPRALASALLKLEEHRRSALHGRLLPWLPHPLPTEPDPLWQSHPPTGERVRRLLALASRPSPGPWQEHDSNQHETRYEQSDLFDHPVAVTIHSPATSSPAERLGQRCA